MAAVLGIVAMVCGVVSLVCWIMVLVKMFQNGQVGLGIVSIFCGIVALVVGWMKATEWNIKNLMLVWTGAIVASIVCNVLATVMAAGGAQ
jgi:hypothetical protein